MLKLKLSFILLLLISSINIYSQEEFFGKQSGLSTFYLNGLGTRHYQANAAGVSAYFKNGANVMAGYVNDGVNISPIVGLSYFFKDRFNEYPVVSFGVSYVPVYDMGQIGFEGIKTLFVNSRFPSSLSGGVTINVEQAARDNNFLDITGAIGLDYTQAFFAKGRIYPYAGVSFVYVPFGDNYMFSALAGINIRLGSKQE